jgi:hypothetical protein
LVVDPLEPLRSVLGHIPEENLLSQLEITLFLSPTLFGETASNWDTINWSALASLLSMRHGPSLKLWIYLHIKVENSLRTQMKMIQSCLRMKIEEAFSNFEKQNHGCLVLVFDCRTSTEIEEEAATKLQMEKLLQRMH